MIQNKILKMLFICLAVVLFAPCESMTESNTVNATEMTETPQTVALQHIDSAELPQSKPMHRHSFKRAVKRFNLAMSRPRVLLRLAVQRIRDGLSKNYDSEGMRRVVETEAQCPSCDVKESNYSPFVIRIAGQPIEAQCVDCALDLQLEMSEQMPRSQAFSALILGISFALVATLFDPTLASSVAFIGAVRRPVPEELKPLKAAGLMVRRIAKNRDTECYECGCELTHNGEYGAPVVMMSRVGYTKKKPHCAQCAVMRFTGNPRPKPTPETPEKPQPAPLPEVKPTPTPEAKPAPVIEVKGDTAQQLAAMIATLATGAIDEEAVRKIAQEEDTALMSKVGDQVRNEITEAIKNLAKPTQITLRKNGKNIELKGIRHFKTEEILFSIVNAKAQNLNLTGEAGTGKTHLLDQIHEALEKSGWFKEMGVKKPRSCYIMSANKDMQAPELIGRESPRFFDDDSGRPAGEWDFLPNELLAQFEHGGILGLDEMDRFADSTLSALNAALANGFITTPKGVRVMRHPACIIIATGNTKGQGASPKYTAANKQDSATLDRFAGNFIDIDYDPAIEEAICANPELLDALRNIRRLGDKHQIKGCVVSYRAMMQGRQYVEAGCSVAFFARRFALQFGAENAIKLGHGQDVEFDSGLWGGA